jgi:hypothetical protein
MRERRFTALKRITKGSKGIFQEFVRNMVLGEVRESPHKNSGKAKGIWLEKAL